MASSRAELLRNDISESLIHFTRAKGEMSALEVLKKILAEGKIEGSTNSGFIKGKKPATCFTEMPISAAKYFATAPDAESPRKGLQFSYYGIAISKRSGFAAGARPVIYLPDDESSWIPEDERWRHVRLEHGEVDWTHEREWRLLGDFDLSSAIGIYILHWKPTERSGIDKVVHPETKKKVRGYFPMQHLQEML